MVACRSTSLHRVIRFHSEFSYEVHDTQRQQREGKVLFSELRVLHDGLQFRTRNYFTLQQECGSLLQHGLLVFE